MYVILRKKGQRIQVDGSDLVVNQIEDKGVLFLHQDCVYDFQEGESFLLGDSIRVKAVRVSSNAARVGIEAPREIPVLRC